MKKRITALILCAIMGIMTAGCGGGDSQGSSQGQGQELSAGQSQETLIVLTGSDASTFDPHFCTDSATEIFNKNIYNNLVRFNKDMEIEPDLAKEWSVSEDQLRKTLNTYEKKSVWYARDILGLRRAPEGQGGHHQQGRCPQDRRAEDARPQLHRHRVRHEHDRRYLPLHGRSRWRLSLNVGGFIHPTQPHY